MLFILDGEYGAKRYLCRRSSNNWQEVELKKLEIKLSEQEKKAFESSINAVRELFNAAQKIDPRFK